MGERSGPPPAAGLECFIPFCCCGGKMVCSVVLYGIVVIGSVGIVVAVVQ